MALQEWPTAVGCCPESSKVKASLSPGVTEKSGRRPVVLMEVGPR